MLRRSFALVCSLIVFSFLFSVGGRSEASKASNFEPEPPAIARLQRDSGGQAVVSYNSATGLASFVRLPRGDRRWPALSGGLTTEAEASAFLETYGAAFGVQAPDRQLQLVGKQRNVAGQTRLTYRQVHEGVDVFAGLLHVQVDENRRVMAANGTFIPGIKVQTTPGLEQEVAVARAVAHVARQVGVGEASNDLAGVNSHLYLFREGLAQRVAGDVRLVYEVEVANAGVTVREFVYVDAHLGVIVDQITGIHEDLEREVSEGSLANVVWQEGDDDPIPAGWAGGSVQQVAAWQDEIDGTWETYNLFASMAARDSYDGAGATMRTVNNDPGINCPNANWNGVSTNYCNGVTADDVVAHEWGHAYTQFTNGLIYQWQSGALNESYSDIWGETVDLLNGRGTDAPDAPRTAGSCSFYGAGSPSTDNSYRWLMGEDATAFSNPIRDMWNPNCNGHPGKVTDTAQYVCTEFDNGGVHINSGIPNHAFALMVDGGTYNGQTITGLGLTKAAHIHWEAQNMLTPTSNFLDHADALEAACMSLDGVNLPALSTDSTDAGASGEVIDAADCQEVAEVIAAVELRTEPAFCGFDPLLEADAPPLCQGLGDVEPIFSENWEGGALPAGWSVGRREVANPATFDTPDWAVVDDLPRGASSDYAAFVPDLIAGNCTTDEETGVLFLESPEITLPNEASVGRLAFDHWVATEAGWDGGNLKVSVNGGPWTLVPSSAFEFNGYNDSLETGISTNPLAGEPAFTGSDEGTLNGSWGQSQLNLNGIAAPGDEVKFRFELGVDVCNGLTGWYVDEVQVYSCSAEVAPPLINADPGAFAATVVSGATFDDILTITNLGDEALNWNITEEIPSVSLVGAKGNSSAETILERNVAEATVQLSTEIDLSREDFTARQTDVAPPAAPPGVTTITHSTSQAIIDGNSAWCPTAPGNSYLRVFDLVNDFDITSTFEVSEVEFGVQVAVATSGEQAATVNLFTLDGPLLYENLTQIGTADTTIADQSFSMVSVPVTGTVAPGEVLVVEVVVPADNVTASFLIGSNAAGQTAPSYLVGPGCGITEPTPTGGIGFPDMHVVMNVTGDVGDDFLPCTNPSDVPWLSVSPESGTTVGGSSNEVTLTYDANGLAAGVYKANVCVSSNASNETMAGALQVPVEMTVVASEYGILLGPDQGQTGFVGDTVTYTLQVTNTGNVADTYNLGVSGNTWNTGLSDSTLALNAGASTVVTATVGVPAGAIDGAMDTALVTATSQGDPGESDSAQVQTTATTIPPTYGVALGPDQATSGVAGDTVTYTLQITNTGDAQDTFDLSVGGNAWSTTLGDESVTLGAGAGDMVTVTVEVPGDAPDGALDTALMTATSQGDPGQSDSVQLETTARTAPLTYGVTLGPDQSATGFVGRTLTYTLQIANTGEVADTFTLSLNGNVWNTALGENSVVLHSGASATLAVTVDVPGDAGDGDVDTVVVMARSQGDPGASDSAVLQTTATESPPEPWRVYVPAILRP